MARVDFVSVNKCLRDGVTEGTLATAIEKEGVYTWDRFGRFTCFKPGTREADEVLDALARVYERDHGLHGGHPDEDDCGVPDSPLDLGGWPRTALPDFALFEADEAQSPARPGSPKEELNNLAIVGALLGCVLGEHGVPRHPEFASQADLVRFLADKMSGIRGMSRRNLEEKFARARRLIDES